MSTDPCLSVQIDVPVHYIEPDGLFNATIARGITSLCVTSANAQEGVSTVSYSVAKRSAASGKQTLLMDANLHNPSVAKRLGMTGATVWNGTSETMEAAIKHFDDINLSILPALDKPIAPVNLRDPVYLREMITRLQQLFDIVIVDASALNTPQTYAIPAAYLAAACEGSVLVVQARVTPEEHLIQAAKSLQAADAVLLGCVLNYQHYAKLSDSIESATDHWQPHRLKARLRDKLVRKLRHIEATL